MKKFLPIFILFILPSYLFAQVSPAAKAIVAKMTTAEKIKLVVGMNYPNPNFKETKLDTNHIVAALQQVQKEDAQLPEKVVGAAGRTHAIPRFNIPILTLSDGPAGVRIDPVRNNDPKTYYATAWPVATLLASTWDVDVVKKVGVAFGTK
jgi:Beta-glucosidase-related glycosidases